MLSRTLAGIPLLVLLLGALSCVVLVPYPILLLHAVSGVVVSIRDGVANWLYPLFTAYTILHPIGLFIVLFVAWRRDMRNGNPWPWLAAWVVQALLYVFVWVGDFGPGTMPDAAG